MEIGLHHVDNLWLWKAVPDVVRDYGLARYVRVLVVVAAARQEIAIPVLKTRLHHRPKECDEHDLIVADHSKKMVVLCR